jgi:hypothetical protein
MTLMVQLGHRSGWAVTIRLIVGLTAAFGLIRHERQVSEPILPFKLWRTVVVGHCNLGSLGMGAVAISISAFCRPMFRASSARA